MLEELRQVQVTEEVQEEAVRLPECHSLLNPWERL